LFYEWLARGGCFTPYYARLMLVGRSNGKVRYSTFDIAGVICFDTISGEYHADLTLPHHVMGGQIFLLRWEE
jgi:hypothetical protein